MIRFTAQTGVVHRASCCTVSANAESWDDKGTVEWVDGHPRYRLGDDVLFTLMWARPCLRCRPDLASSPSAGRQA